MESSGSDLINQEAEHYGGYNRPCLIQESIPSPGKETKLEKKNHLKRDITSIKKFKEKTGGKKRDPSPGRPGKKKLEALLNGHLKIKMTDGRVLIGIFLCTDRDANVILGSCSEYLKEEDYYVEEPRILGLVMVPGRHIVSIHRDQC